MHALAAPAGVSAAASWAPVPGAGPGYVLLRPGDTRLAPCELELRHAPSSGGGGAPTIDAGLQLRCGARLVELRVQGAVDREPQYVATLRGVPHAASAECGSAPAGGGAGATRPHPHLWDFALDLPHGWCLAHVKLLSLADKGSCVVSLQLRDAGSAGPMGGGGGGASQGCGGQQATLSQLEELRLLVRHAATGPGQGAPAQALPPSLHLLQHKLAAGTAAGGAAAAAQAMAAAVARGVLLEERVQCDERQRSSQQQGAEQRASTAGLASAACGAGTPAALAAQPVGAPSADARWLAAHIDVGLAALEARLGARLGELASRVAALEVHLPAAGA